MYTGKIASDNFQCKIVDAGQLDNVMRIVGSAINKMRENGVEQWDEVYPDLETFRQDVNSKTLYGYYNAENKLCGFLALNSDQPEEYFSIDWKHSDERPLAVHRLCVDPKYQGHGIAKKLIKFTEEYAAENNYQSIRLDAFCDNSVSCAMYRKLGYVERGIVNFRKGRFYCFEKVICNKNIGSSEEIVGRLREG
jgi:ribosomal protein S18 acetylase RimI-like enzyme